MPCLLIRGSFALPELHLAFELETGAVTHVSLTLIKHVEEPLRISHSHLTCTLEIRARAMQTR